MRVLLIVNTSASFVTARARVVIHKALSADHEVILKETNRRGHATRLAQGAAADGLDVAVVLGGDGTLNEAANGLAGSPTALAVLPGGSTNVFARTLGMANDPIEATSQLLSALAAGSVQRVGLGELNGRYFLFHAGMGFDAAVVRRVEEMAGLKRYFGPALFIVATLLTWAKGYERHRPAFSLRAGATLVDDAYFSICLNTDPYTFLGSRPLHIAPETSFATPLSMVTFESLSLATMMPMLVTALGEGTGTARRRHVSLMTGLEGATIKGYGPVPYQLDGDYVGEADHIELRWAAEALSIVVPTAAGATIAQKQAGSAVRPVAEAAGTGGTRGTRGTGGVGPPGAAEGTGEPGAAKAFSSDEAPKLGAPNQKPK
ncbi:MAG TPA: diacylglycerol kinase family protein [Acidimicrobiales bacterium]|nr:diacylglycerol kinase family protein [Acidimicrobiales bacterium]